uniref:Putative secreted protein n=1 Tax=Ixodes ricinus TaxID=34613 RepID=A0A6B0U4A6_IXORI
MEAATWLFFLLMGERLPLFCGTSFSASPARVTGQGVCQVTYSEFPNFPRAFLTDSVECWPLLRFGECFVACAV